MEFNHEQDLNFSADVIRVISFIGFGLSLGIILGAIFSPILFGQVAKGIVVGVGTGTSIGLLLLAFSFFLRNTLHVIPTENTKHKR